MLDSADRWPSRALLLVNLGVASFVAIAHGGALWVLKAHLARNAPAMVESIAMVSLPLAAILILSALVALAKPNIRLAVLGLHGFVLLVGVLAMFAWVVSILVNGFPNDFAWGPGLFTISVGYAVFLFTRYSIPARARLTPLANHAPLIALAVAGLLDVAVIVCLAQDMAERFSR